MTDALTTRRPGAFAPAEHPYVGTARAFLPNGTTPYAPPVTRDPAVILPAGDTVDVLSAWTRDYLPADAPTLLFVRSRATGCTTHVTAADLPVAPEPAPAVHGPRCDARHCWAAPAYVTNRGWLVCEAHWTPRDRYTSCRKLTPAERRRLAATGRMS